MIFGTDPDQHPAHFVSDLHDTNKKYIYFSNFLHITF